MSSASTMIVFPSFIGSMTGVSYVQVGIRKVWAVLTDGRSIDFPRKKLPDVLPDGNSLAFEVAKIISGE